MIKQVSTTSIRSFIPEWEGNKDLEPIEQIKVNYKAVTIAMKEKLFPRSFEFSVNGDPIMSVTVDRKKVLHEVVTGIDNVNSCSEDGITKKISTVEQLFTAGIEFDALVEEIYTFCTDLINQKGVDEKN